MYVDDAGLDQRVLKRDVATRWNSTYDMAVMALEYRVVIDRLTAEKASGLRKYELGEEEWGIIKELVRVLKVRNFSPFVVRFLTV
jgi:hypothetical protein